MSSLFVGCDAHKHYSQLEVQDSSAHVLRQCRIDHARGALAFFFSTLPHGTPLALESVGNWYWIADEIEAAGCHPLLPNPAKAKLLMGHVNKTDKLDAAGLTTLLRLGSLPSVWLPPAELRDERELPRTRMVLCAQRTQIKNRIRSCWPSTISVLRTVPHCSHSTAGPGWIRLSPLCLQRLLAASRCSSSCWTPSPRRSLSWSSASTPSSP